MTDQQVTEVQPKRTPYHNLADKQFWKTGVAHKELGKQLFDHLHAIEFANSPKLSSIGSCFAQHVGKWLINKGYHFNKSQLDTSQVSSFAFGNVYTPRCLLQWFNHADLPSEHTVYHQSGRYFDLLRPSINPSGFCSLDELVAARKMAVEELYRTLEDTDVLIFTLGLTEAWKDLNNVFYPSCPGVIEGEFNSNVYSFYNFSYEEIKADVQQIFATAKRINPHLRFILTVSPVPLTATATNQHILVANQYSKSTLRSVAGALANELDEVMYFPSFEIITVNGGEDFRFESNRRNVSKSAVDYVMQHFESAFGKQNNSITKISSNDSDDDRGEQTAQQANLAANADNPSELSSNPYNRDRTAIADEIVCDEEMLEAIRTLNPTGASQAPHKLTLFGDSHFGKLSSTLNDMGVAHCGGMIMNGSGFAQKKFALCGTEYLVPLQSAAARKLWAKVYANLNAHEQAKQTNHSTILTNMGMQTHQTATFFIQWYKTQQLPPNHAIVTQDITKFINEEQNQQFSTLIRLRQAGHRVIVISDPPFSQCYPEYQGLWKLIYAYFTAVQQICEENGITFYNAADAMTDAGLNIEDYKSDYVYADGQVDWYHGNSKYYHWLAEKLLPIVTEQSTS